VEREHVKRPSYLFYVSVYRMNGRRSTCLLFFLEQRKEKRRSHGAKREPEVEKRWMEKGTSTEVFLRALSTLAG
jgi:hypothetical protein